MSLIGMMVDITKYFMLSKCFSYTGLNSKEHIRYNIHFKGNEYIELFLEKLLEENEVKV